MNARTLVILGVIGTVIGIISPNALASVTVATQEPATQAFPTLTFEEALSQLEQHLSAAPAEVDAADLEALRRSRLPSVRAEVNANASRTLDLFSQGPYEVRYSTAALAFDYPLWDGGTSRARIRSLEERVRRAASVRGRLDDRRFAELLDAFADLYLVQQQAVALRAFQAERFAEAERSAFLLESGEISNLMAIERREASLALSSLLLDLEARRIDASDRLRGLTGIEGEPAVAIDLAPRESGSVDLTRLQDDVVIEATHAVAESRTRLQLAVSGNRFRANLSGFGGIGTAESRFSSVSSQGSFGVYGLRVLFAYPLFGGPSLLSEVEARLELQRSISVQSEAVRAAQTRAAQYVLRIETAQKRTALLEESVQHSHDRVESLARLVQAGVRLEAELLHAQSDRARRETDLLGARVDVWKARRLLERMTATGAERTGSTQP